MPGLIHESSPLFDIAQLEDNWDGRGAITSTTALLEKAQEFVDKLKLLFYENQMPTICPGHAGDIAFLWIDAADTTKELEIKLQDDQFLLAAWHMRLPNGDMARGNCRTVDRCIAVAAYYLMQCEITEEKISASLKP